MATRYQVRIEQDGYDAGWYDFKHDIEVGRFITSVLATFDNEALFSVRQLEVKPEEQTNE